MSPFIQHFTTARSLRQEMLAYLESQQRRDAEASQKVKACFLRHQEMLSNTLASLLMTYASRTHYAAEESVLFEAILPDARLEDWGSLTREVEGSKYVAEKASAERDEAKARYDKHSPFGPLSRVFADDNFQRQSKELKAEFEKYEGSHKFAQRRMDTLTQEVKEFAKNFLRRALGEDRLLYLTREPSPIREEVCNHLQSLSSSLNEIWQQHATVQQQSCQEIRSALDALESDYLTK